MDEEIKRKTKYGMLWNALEKLTNGVLIFVLNVILARLLSPSDYGIIGILSVFLVISNVFVESGFSKALIQKNNCTDEDYSTVFIFNLCIGLLIYILLFFCAPFIADFYDDQSLVKYSRVLFLVIIANSLGVVQYARLQISIDFKKIAIVNCFCTLISGLLAVGAAFGGAGIWALIIQSISKQLFFSLMLFILGHWRPKIVFSFSSFRSLFSYGSKLLISSLVIEITSNLSNVLIGKIHSTEKLGYYTKGYQFPDVTVGTLSSVFNSVSFPLMSSLQSDSKDLINTFRRLIVIAALLSYPSLIGLAVLSKEIIVVILSEKWLESSFFMTCIALSYFFKPLSILNVNLLNAVGRSDLYLKLNIIKVPMDLIIIAVALPFGVKTLAIVNAVCSCLYFYVNSFAIGKLYKFGAFKQFACTWKPFVASIIMGGSILLLKFLMKDCSDILKLVTLIPYGVISYYLLLKLFKESEVTVVESFFKRKIKIGN